MRAIEGLHKANKRIIDLISEEASESRILPLLSSSRALRVSVLKENPDVKDQWDVGRFQGLARECEEMDRTIFNWMREGESMSPQKFAHALLPLTFDYKSDMALVSGVPDEILEEWAKIGVERFYAVETDDPSQIRTIQAYIQSLSSPIGNLFCHRMPEAGTSPEFFRDCALAARDAGHALSAYTNTLHALGETVFENTVANLPYVKKKVTDIQVPGAEVVVLCAGPSLKDALDLLPLAKEKSIVVALSHTLRTLAEIGFEPDFVIACDPQAIMEEHIKGLDLSRMRLLGALSLPPAVFQAGWKEVFAFGCNDDLDAWLEIDLPHVHTGGSAAGGALSLAVAWGAAGVTFVGHDLAFGQAGERYGVVGVPQWTEHHQIEVEAVGGGTVKTSESMDLFRRFFEDAARVLREKRPQFSLRNVSQVGAKINGWQHMKLGNVLAGTEPARALTLKDGLPLQGHAPLARLSTDLETLDFEKRLHEKAKGFLGRRKRELLTRSILRGMTWTKCIPQKAKEDYREYLGRLVSKRELLKKEAKRARRASEASEDRTSAGFAEEGSR